MEKHNLYDYYKGLSTTGKTIVGITAAGIAVFVGYSIWQAVKQAKANSANLTEAKKSVDALNQLAQGGTLPSFTDAQFESWSNDLVKAFGGCGTDEQTVYSIFSSLNNAADLYKLIAVYGTRDYDGCLWGTSSNSLSAAISDELDSSEKGVLNGILSQKTIPFQFS